MAKDQGALKPEFVDIRSYIEREKVEEDQPSQDEKILASGADKAFWKVLKRYFEEEMYSLEQINEHAIASGLPFDEIGRNALVINQVKGVLRKITNRVDDAKEEADKRIQ